VTRGIVLAIAILAALVAAVLIIGYVVAEGSRVDPYKNRAARLPMKRSTPSVVFSWDE
jgi:hypothetical protein